MGRRVKDYLNTKLIRKNKIAESKEQKPIQVLLDYPIYLKLKGFCSDYDSTISECVRILITDHLEQIELGN